MRLLLLDDHAVVRAGVRLVLDGMAEVPTLDEASLLAEALSVAIEPDVIVADLILPDANGADLVRSLRERFPEARILVLTMVDAPATVEAVMAAGANGYLLKEAAADELLQAIRVVAAGSEYLQPALGVALARRATDPVHQLTGRERDVLRLIVLGHTNAEIARTLFVSERTIESHRASLASKLGTQTRAELVRAAIDLGLVDLL